MPKEYRGIKCAVGPLILRTLLTETLKKHANWSIAMYVPYSKGQFPTQDEAAQAERNQHIDEGTSSLELREQKERLDRRKQLTRVDMRLFFRAGFCQLTDPSVIEESSNFYVYTVPSNYSRNNNNNNNTNNNNKGMSQSQSQKILTEQEALEIEIVESPPGPPEQTTKEKDLFKFMLDASRHRQEMVRKIDGHRRPIRELDEYRNLFEQSEENIQLVRNNVQELQKMKQLQEIKHDNETKLSILQGLPMGDSLRESIRVESTRVEERLAASQAIMSETIEQLRRIEEALRKNLRTKP